MTQTETTKITLALLTVAALLSPSAARAETSDARQIIEKATKQNKAPASESVSVLTLYSARGHKRVRKTAAVSKLYDNGKTEKLMIRFLSPADVKGTGFLTFDYEQKDDDMWLFLPALRKTRRIISSEKSKSFMGSEFSYNDMNIPNLDDFTYARKADASVDGVACFVIETRPRNKKVASDNGFSRKLSYIGKTDYVTRKAMQWDLGGALHKEIKATKVKRFGTDTKIFRATFMEVVNKKNRRRSTLEIKKLVVTKDAKDEYFTIRYLERQ